MSQTRFERLYVRIITLIFGLRSVVLQPILQLILLSWSAHLRKIKSILLDLVPSLFIIDIWRPFDIRSLCVSFNHFFVHFYRLIYY